MWKYEEDKTNAVITAEKHIASCRKSSPFTLPETAVIFFMHGGIDYTAQNYNTKIISERFPSFFNSRPVYAVDKSSVCFLHGGWGAPMAADTLETLFALGVKNVVSVGMFGAFSENINSGDIVIPNKAFIEEGTSFHYYSDVYCSKPNIKLMRKALEKIDSANSYPIVSTDAVYRQTFYKENLWRSKGAVGVDMETSVLFSVGDYLGINAVSLLIASDIHPLTENNEQWKWKMTKDIRCGFFEKCMDFALHI